MKLIYIDLFCGAGGVTTGIMKAIYEGKKIADVIACVNHDPVAIESHAANHSEAMHYTEDIRTLDITELVAQVKDCRLTYPDAIICLWASLECTNFSRAKGGLPREADSRTLANHLFRYIEEIDPHYIDIENVEEFMSWGPLDDKGKPLSRKNGRDYVRWVNKVQAYGYSFDWRILNAADFGAYTSRKRYFAQFAKSGLPIVWPEATHSKNPSSGMFGGLKKWKAVKEVLDFEDEGRSIFGRKKPLSENTLARIYAGLIKYVAGGKENFILKYNSTSQSGVHLPPSVDDPCPTIATQNRLGVVKASFIQKHYSGKPEGKVTSIDSPLGTITTKANQSIIQTKFLTKYHGNGENLLSIEKPASTLSTKDRLAIVQAHWLDKQYSGKDNHQSLETAAASLTVNPKLSLITTEGCGHYYLMNPQYASAGRSVNDPCFTLIARMDKKPPYLVSAENGGIAIEINDTDSDYTRKVKLFMALYGIADIKMRMLKVPELLKIQGFPNGYYLAGNQTDQKKFIGNSVPPKLVKAMTEAKYKGLINYKERRAVA